jgi:hypothetical protein
MPSCTTGVCAAQGGGGYPCDCAIIHLLVCDAPSHTIELMVLTHARGVLTIHANSSSSLRALRLSMDTQLPREAVHWHGPMCTEASRKTAAP